MKVLVAGSGGREHALTWKIAQSPLVDAIHCAPGNPGMERYATCHPLDVNDFKGLRDIITANSIDLVVIGPEAPLAAGLTDYLADTGANVFGPTARGAEIEASKAYAKDLLHRKAVPTALYAKFEDPRPAKDYVKRMGVPIVVKADGLAGGKGVAVARTKGEAAAAIEAMMVGRAFGEAGKRIVLEDCLSGEEASILAFTDGNTLLTMPPSQDHKPVYNDDQGPNTGGMGAYSPAPVITPDLMREIEDTILKPVMEGLAEDDRPYKGVLYAGLMITGQGPQVIEFNCRFGDPEAQVVLPRLKTDIVPLMVACCEGTLDQHSIEWNDDACVSVVMASGGYPRDYEKGKRIAGIERAEETGALVFHAGTKREGNELVTAGGRVLNVTALGPDIPQTIEKAYHAVAMIGFEGAHFRNDIGKKALRHLV